MIVDNSDQQSNKNDQQQKQQLQLQKQDHKTLNHHSLYYTFIQRYFTSYQNQTQILHMHSNGLFLIRAKVDSFKSKPINIKDVLMIQQVKGKKKKGGSRVGKNTIIVQIQCQNGDKIPIYCLIQGVIIQKNARCNIQNLHLAQGYIAIINPVRKFKLDKELYRQIELPHQIKNKEDITK